MPTIITSTIGATGDYAQPADWIADCPANLVTADVVYRGELRNDYEFTTVSGPLVVIPAATTDATRYIELTVAAGQSLWDAPDIRTVRLAHYDASRGVGLRGVNFDGHIQNHAHYTRISRIQLTPLSGVVNSGTNNGLVRDVIISIEGDRRAVVDNLGTGTTYINCLFVLVSGFTAALFNLSASNSTFIGCTFVALEPRHPFIEPDAFDVSVFMTSGVTSGVRVQSCAFFGIPRLVAASSLAFLTFDAANSFHNGGSLTGTTAAKTLPGANALHNLPYGLQTPFAHAATDLRPIFESRLVGAGSLIEPLDASGFARASPPTIGALEASVYASGRARSQLQPATDYRTGWI